MEQSTTKHKNMTSPSNFQVVVNNYLSAEVLVLPISINFIIIIPKLFTTLAAHTYSLIFIFLALEVAVYPYRILQIKYVDVDVG